MCVKTKWGRALPVVFRDKLISLHCRLILSLYTWVSPAAMLLWPPGMLFISGIFELHKVGQRSDWILRRPTKPLLLWILPKKPKDSIILMIHQVEMSWEIQPNQPVKVIRYNLLMIPFVAWLPVIRFSWLLESLDWSKDMLYLMWLWLTSTKSTPKLINWL